MSSMQFHFTLKENIWGVQGAQTCCLSWCVTADTFIQKTRKLYQDTRTQRNLSKLNDDLFEVQQIMTRNIQEVLGVGDRLDRMFLTSKCLDPLTFVDATLSTLDQFACISCFIEELTSFFSWWISIKYSMSSALGSLSLLKSQTCWHLVIISGGSLIVKLKSS